MNEEDHNTRKIAHQIAAREPRHLDKPTAPPLGWRVVSPTTMTIILNDGRKVTRAIPSQAATPGGTTMQPAENPVPPQAESPRTRGRGANQSPHSQVKGRKNR